MITTENEKKQGFTNWLKESVTVKLTFIGILILLLMIPSSLVQNLIAERANRQDETLKTISDEWSGRQLIQGPVLVIPYKKTVMEFDDQKRQVPTEVIDYLYILPENLNIKANVASNTLHRGIFEAVVYTTKLKLSGNFAKLDLSKIQVSPSQLLLDQAKLTFSISDLKGLQTNPVVNITGKSLSAEPALTDKTLFPNGLQTAVNLSGFQDKSIPFDFALDLKGSQELEFLHLGKTTQVEAQGNWRTPSFEGRYLPDERKIDQNGFSAKWKMLYYNRPFPQQWVGNDTMLNSMQTKDEAIFGVKLRLPVDQYQKTTRTSKYSLLIILLTFISLFLTELIGKHRVHAFNYILIGAAMVIYYTLLLSFAEQMGYNLAYLIASLATIALVASFIASLLKNRKVAIIFTIILSLFYTFIFVIIQLEDLSLLIGSIALFIIIAGLMYFSRKINWDKQ